MGSIRTSAVPEECGVGVREIRRTRAGDVLVELRRTTAEARTRFFEAVQKAAVGVSSARELIPRVRLEICDVDCCTTKDEVEEALRRALPERPRNLQVNLTRPNTRQQVAAIVTLDEISAKALLRTARVKVGWVNCRIRRRTEIPRCFKCLGFGHQSDRCPGPDRGKACYRCGAGEHKAKECKESPKCFLCAENGERSEAHRHVAGSGKCGAFRTAFARARR